jgi:transcriptional regulator with XRE-family HTH domain
MPGQPQQAREALGSRLREIRLDARLTARALAQLTGWHFTKVSKLEHGTRRPSPDDIRAWCKYCQAEDQVIDLIATALGIIPDAGDRYALAQGSSWIFDETRVQLETVSAGLDITQPAEISLYGQVFDLLQRSAVYGHGARELIRRAVGDLSRE